jgi:hypothetical protein
MDNKIWRYSFCEQEGMLKGNENGHWCHYSHAERLQKERDALQQLLNARDEEVGRLRVILDVDLLSNIIRKVDGGHSLGAGVLAEKIIYELENQA